MIFDTIVFGSAFLFSGSQGGQALLLAHRPKVDLYISTPILTEAARVLREKFDQFEGVPIVRLADFLLSVPFEQGSALALVRCISWAITHIPEDDSEARAVMAEGVGALG